MGGRTASQIINQVTTQGSPSRIAGTIEVFGAQADVIIANPNGITCTACGFINTPRVVMTTGEPQFLAARGGAASGFDTAAALSYNVTGGHIQIEGLAGANGTPGAGIEGSAGVIDLIGGSVGINASINAGRQINVISGQQLVSEAAAGLGKAGSDYNVISNGSASNFSGPTPGIQKYVGTKRQSKLRESDWIDYTELFNGMVKIELNDFFLLGCEKLRRFRAMLYGVC